ncbi:ATP-binding protein [Niabella soli]|uniref:Molecular chaperone of HSP90 family n=1 Tax=Niabella soli DSM 19437 TaxID=929713 RepID=W0F0F2_9BACT|nr:ATP-binding protein [Niabella soli]AHF14929.1 molecular chaperone of HSP90 family [Niabella soli DSM 19437]
MKQQNKVNIRPQVTMLSVLKHIEYQTWFALAEFIDNAIDSYLKNEKAIKEVEGENFQLEVRVEINEPENRITIRDNAGGIGQADYARAFRAAEVPPDNSGLSEFGMGMKSAACWFADNWCVTTTALREDNVKKVVFDMQKIFEDKLEELDVEAKPCDKKHHYTVVELYNVNRIPKRKGVAKVKDHLRSIYREFIRKGILKLTLNGEELIFNDPNVLNVPKHDEPSGEPILWRKEIDFDIAEVLSVHGFVAIREKASTAEAGFALFRRGRVIEGSFDEGFRPDFIFGAPNSYRYQRVFGELHLDGFSVNFTKKGIQWDENLDIFLRLLKDDISSKEFPLLQQAEQYRVRATEKEYKAAVKALDETVNDFEKKAPQAVADVVNNVSAVETPEKEGLTKTEQTLHREFDLRFNKTDWKVSIELSYDPSLTELIEVGDSFIKEKVRNSSVRQIGIRLSLTHPFMVEFAGADTNKIEPILRIAAAFGLSEIIAKDSYKNQGEVRRNFNELIANLSK